MKKLYRAYADNGRDFFGFLFESEHRANSKANKAEAVKAWKKHHGRGARCVIISTSRAQYTGECPL